MVDKTLGDAEKMIGGGVSALGKGAQGFNKEFMDFLQKYQVIGLAVAFVIGTAASKLVTSTVADVIMPIIAVIVPGGDWRSSVLQIGPIKFLVGDFVGALIDFFIIALVIFIVVKYIMKGDTTKKI
jgi:large conductance mechanosensitive channel